MEGKASPLAPTVFLESLEGPKEGMGFEHVKCATLYPERVSFG